MTYNSNTGGQYLTPGGACEIIPGMTVGGLAQLRFRGAGPKFLKPTPKKVLYRRQDIIDWLEASEQTGTGRERRAA